jgi:hypothetical protein
LERRQIADQYENDKKFDLIFEALDRQAEPVQGVFFDGQIWDSHIFMTFSDKQSLSFHSANRQLCGCYHS